MNEDDINKTASSMIKSFDEKERFVYRLYNFKATIYCSARKNFGLFF